MKYIIDFSFLDDFTSERITSKQEITKQINDYLKRQKNQGDMIAISFFQSEPALCTISIYGWADIHTEYNQETGKQIQKRIMPYYIDVTMKTDYQYVNLYHYEKKRSITIDGGVRKAIYSNNMDKTIFYV